MIRKSKSFRGRAFVSFLLLFSFLLSALSGVVLFLRPEGSLAAWTGWSVLGLDKKQWEGVHAIFVFVLIVSASIHLLYNWRALTAYCRRRTKQAAASFQGLGPWREFMAAALLVALILVGSLGKWLPGRWIADLRGACKSGSTLAAVSPPVADADKLTLAELCPLLGITETRILAAARGSGIKVESLGQTLADVASKNGLSPEDVYILLGGKRSANPSDQ